MALKQYTADETARMESRHARSIKIAEKAIADLKEGAENPTEVYKALNRAYLTLLDARQAAHVDATQYAHEQAALRNAATEARLKLEGAPQ